MKAHLVSFAVAVAAVVVGLIVAPKIIGAFNKPSAG